MTEKRKVDYCKNSKISEAWITVKGKPAELSQEVKDQASALINEAKKHYNDVTHPNILVVNKINKDGPSNPHWFRQISWLQGQHIARFGHRYLSVHFLKQKGKKYERFDESLKQPIQDWLNIYKDTLTESPQHEIESIGFGYVNKFKHDTNNFNLAKWFNLDLGITIPNMKDGLLHSSSNFKFHDSVYDANVSINIEIEQASTDPSALNIETRVYSETIYSNFFSFDNDKKIIEEITKMKESSKENFFDFTTQYSHEEMEVQYV